MRDRITYYEIRTWLLDCYYVYCREKMFSGSQWEEGEHELGYAYDQYSDAFHLPIEKIMLEVLVLVLASGRLTKSALYHYQKISEFSAGTRLHDIANDLPPDERNDFLYDLSILKLV
ncbi:hypothetical protein RugamoR57_39360 [Duganella caerulea]|uniref:hypothetical protein n=1 Tax=Duganella caerulea TaxID=2885762 RepID=UPI0030E7A7BB